MALAAAALALSAPPGSGPPPLSFETLVPPLPPNAPKPSPDPRDFEGTWIHDRLTMPPIQHDMHGNAVPLTATARSILERRMKATHQEGTPYGNAAAMCLPPGPIWQLDHNFPFRIFQTPRVVTLLFQEYHGIMNVRMNKAHRVEKPTYMGDSVGHWDGNTLVVETTNFKKGMWVDVEGTPASKHARITQRMRRIPNGPPELEIVTTIDDPENYAKPWSFVSTFAWRPNLWPLKEYNCEWQVGGPGGSTGYMNHYGLIPEPTEEP
jgi:hypothetical protein